MDSDKEWEVCEALSVFVSEVVKMEWNERL